MQSLIHPAVRISSLWVSTREARTDGRPRSTAVSKVRQLWSELVCDGSSSFAESFFCNCASSRNWTSVTRLLIVTVAVASMLATHPARLRAQTDVACCGGEEQGAQFAPAIDLESATNSALGWPSVTEFTLEDAAQSERIVQDFSREAAAFAIANGGDDRGVLQLFERMVEQRSLPLLPSKTRTQMLADTVHTMMAFAPTENPLLVSSVGGEAVWTPEHFLADYSYRESATSLLSEVATGRVPFVIGGTPDVDDEFLDCVAIGNANGFFCTGTLVHPRLVVTALHCRPANITQIFIGRQVSPALDPNGHTHEVEEVKRFRTDAGGEGPPHDILVLVLKNAVPADQATPREVATVADVRNAKWGWIAGFGTSAFDPTIGASGFGVRRKSAVPLIPGSLRSEEVANSFGCHFEFEFATGNLWGQASCFGDSGGPVYVVGEDDSVKLAGAVSRALKRTVLGPEICGLGAVNTLVPKYSDLLIPPEDGDDTDGDDTDDDGEADNPTEPPDDPPEEPTPQVVHELSVRRHTAAGPLSNSDTDRIFRDATNALQTVDGAGDVACAVSLVRQGSVQDFSIGDGTIDSSAELRAVLNSPGWIKVVREINWCGSPGTSIIGCAPVPGSSLAIVRFTPSQEGVLWLHEFGHNKGLSHRDQANAVMRPFIGISHRFVTQAECNRFSSLSAVSAAEEQFSAAGPVDEKDVPVEEFVQRRYVRGIPWDEASRYSTEADVNRLIAILADPEAAAFRDNVAATLALSGSKKSIKPLIDLIRQGEGNLSEDEYRAKRTAVMFLGVAANKTGKPRPVKFLTKLAQQNRQANRQFAWTIEGNEEAAYRQERLATMAIWGLSLSGSKEAVTVLEGLNNNLPANFSNDSGAAVVTEALEAAATIQEKGLMGYYGAQH